MPITFETNDSQTVSYMELLKVACYVLRSILHTRDIDSIPVVGNKYLMHAVQTAFSEVFDT